MKITESTVNYRLNKFIKAENISIREFERRCELSNGYVKGVKNSIGHDKMRSITLQFPHLNTVWLIAGEGEMFKPSLESAVNNTVSSGNVSTSNIGNGNNRNVISISLPEQGSKKIIESNGTIRIESESQKTNDLPDNMEQMYISRIADLEKLIKAYSEIIELLKK